MTDSVTPKEYSAAQLVALLEELRQDLDRVREAHQLLALELKSFGNTLGLARVHATDASVTEDADAA